MIGLREDIEEMFGGLVVPFDSRSAKDWTWMHSGDPKDVGIRVRRIGRDPEKVAARADRHRETSREAMRRLRRRRKRLAYFRERWADLKSAPLVPVEIDGVIWMRPPAELERRRERAREYQRRMRGQP